MPATNEKLTGFGSIEIAAGVRVTIDPELVDAEGNTLIPTYAAVAEGGKWVSTQNDGTFDIQNISQETLVISWAAAYLHSTQLDHDLSAQTNIGPNGANPSPRAAIDFDQVIPSSAEPPGAYLNLSDNPVGLWDMNGYDGANQVPNRVPGGSPLTVFAAGDYFFECDSSFVAGQKGIMVDGANIYIPGNNETFTTGDFTFIWANVESDLGNTTFRPIMSWRSPLIGATPLQTWTLDPYVNFEHFLDSTAGPVYSANGRSARGGKRVWGIRRESNVQTIFLNGYPVYTSAALAAPAGGGAQDFWIGSLQDANNLFKGEAGPAALYHTALSNAKIQEKSFTLLGKTS